MKVMCNKDNPDMLRYVFLTQEQYESMSKNDINQEETEKEEEVTDDNE
jgi:hypothetical protein